MEKKMEKPKAVKLKTASKLLDVCTKTTRRYIKDGKLRGVRVGGLNLVVYDSIEKLLGIEQEAA
jgi:excisionase family DNA binding protein